MKRTILLIILCLNAFLGVAQDNHPVSWKFSSEKVDALTYKIKLVAIIREPFHIYPGPSSDAGLGMPTEFLFVENPNVQFIGAMEEKGFEQKNGEPLPYYSKRSHFYADLTIEG